MLTFEYLPYNSDHAVADGDVKSFVDWVLEEYLDNETVTEVVFGTQNVFTEVRRQALKRSDIALDEIAFKFNGRCDTLDPLDGNDEQVDHVWYDICEEGWQNMDALTDILEIKMKSKKSENEKGGTT